VGFSRKALLIVLPEVGVVGSGGPTAPGLTGTAQEQERPAAAATASRSSSISFSPALTFPVTGVSLFLDLKALFKAFVHSYTAARPASSDTSSSTSGNSRSGSIRVNDIDCWKSTGGPATFAHMLSLAAPVPSSTCPC
jgi:hypothetical protein